MNFLQACLFLRKFSRASVQIIICLALGSCESSQKSVRNPESDFIPASNTARTGVDNGEFFLGPDDEITVTVWRQDDMKTTTAIDPSGHIDMPLIGRIKAAGMTPSGLARDIEGRLANYLNEPRVSVSMAEVGSQNIYVLGEVKAPGMHPMVSNMSAWEAVAKAGGFSSNADMKRIVIVRETEGPSGSKAVAEAYTLSSPTKVGQTGRSSAIPRLTNRDIVYVPTSKIATVGNFMSQIDTILRPFLNTASVIVLGDSAYQVFFPEKLPSRNESIAISP